MKLFFRNIFALLAVTASMLTSCGDDVALRTGEESAGSGIIVYLPEMPEGATPASGTRSEGQLAGFTRSEATVGKCRLFIYNVDATGKVGENPITGYTLKQNNNPIQNIPGYGAYQLEDLPTGEYKIYVTANVDLPSNTQYSQLINSDQKFGLLTDASLAGGLPMSCRHEDLEVDGKRINNESIRIQPGVGNMTIKANLQYAVSKIRITVINDLAPKSGVTKVNVKNHLKSSTVFSGLRDSNAERGELAGQNEVYDVTGWGKYYNLVNVADNGIAKTNVDNIGNPISFSAGTPYTYQTVFYVPERLFQTKADCTAASITIGDITHTQPLGHDDNDGKGFALKRSHFYDYVGTPDGKFFLQVQNWDIETMAGALNGTYWLKVDQTNLTVKAGEPTELKFSTNALSVTPGCVGNIYTFDKIDGGVAISLNKDIDRDAFNAIYSSDDWKYITLTAGTIVKKIEINNIEFNEYIKDDTMVTIDVSERKTSGEYNSSIPVELQTNLKYVTFEKIDWPAAAGEGSPASLILQDKNGNAITTNSKISVPASGKIEFRVAYNGLNSNRKLWQEDHNMSVLIKGVDASGNPIVANGNNVQCNVGIYVRTSYDVYRIHLKAPAWKHPHIYVYQCLQLPGEFDESRNGAKAKQTVGYKIFASAYAAIEYDFTGAVAFKGWFVNANNNPYAAGFHSDNFFMFNNHYSNASDNWSPALLYFDDNNKNGTENLALKNGLHYYRMDFASAHRKKLKEQSRCSACTATPIPTAWPGIHMIPDPTKPANSGWWYFELSGVADPGKALIMFTDCDANSHNWTDQIENNNRRYPKQEQPGVALFDNANKEGWFVFSGNSAASHSFLSEDPGN
ncbi:MAG: hypothetical protein K2M31_09100 [Muribaculaceae bacterium]|nr:hypothetical protein [Muribaculaceae bacterium]